MGVYNWGREEGRKDFDPIAARLRQPIEAENDGSSLGLGSNGWRTGEVRIDTLMFSHQTKTRVCGEDLLGIICLYMQWNQYEAYPHHTVQTFDPLR